MANIIEKHKLLEDAPAGNLCSTHFALPKSVPHMPNSIHPSHVCSAAAPVAVVAVLLYQVQRTSRSQ